MNVFCKGGIQALCVTGLIVLILILNQAGDTERVALPHVSLSEVEQTDGVFRLLGQAEPFTGFVVENYPEGPIRSRVQVEEGLLHGLSEGWFADGVRQVQETFLSGVSNGQRVKWYASGSLKSKEEIIEGNLEGTFLEWHENGQLAKQIPLIEGVAHGVSRAWFSSGFLKARVTLEGGKVVTQQFFSDGDLKERADEGVPLRVPHPSKSSLTQSESLGDEGRRANG